MGQKIKIWQPKLESSPTFNFAQQATKLYSSVASISATFPELSQAVAGSSLCPLNATMKEAEDEDKRS